MQGSLSKLFYFIPWCGWTKDHPEYCLQSISILITLFQKLSLYSLVSPHWWKTILLCKKKKKWTSEYCFWSVVKWFNNNVSSYFLNDFKTLMHCRGLPLWHNEMGQFRLQPAVWGPPQVQSSMTVLSPFLFIFLSLFKSWVIFLRKGMSLSISYIQLVIDLHWVKIKYFLELNLLLWFDYESRRKIQCTALLHHWVLVEMLTIYFL